MWAPLSRGCFEIFEAQVPNEKFRRKKRSKRRWNESNMAVCQNLVPLVNIKIAGKWMLIPLKMVLIGIDPYQHIQNLDLYRLNPWKNMIKLWCHQFPMVKKKHIVTWHDQERFTSYWDINMISIQIPTPESGCGRRNRSDYIISH